MMVEKPRGGPAPAVGFELEVGVGVVLHDVDEREAFAGGDVVFDDLDAAPVRDFITAGGYDGELEFAVFPVMRGEQLGGAFHVPRWASALEPAEHEGVRAFVQHEVAAVVAARLIVEPDLRADGVAGGEVGEAVCVETDGGEAAFV